MRAVSARSSEVSIHNMKPVRVGVIGLGMVAQIMHLPYLKEMEEFEITAVCDAAPELSKRIAAFFGVPNAFTDYKDLIACPDVDAIIILTFYHSDIAVAAAAAGKHILCEKPVSFSAQECRVMMNAAERAGIIFMVGYMKRFDEGYRLGQKYFGEMKKKGDVRYISVHDACFRNDLAIRSMYDLWQYPVPAAVMKESSAKIGASLKQAMGSAPAYVVGAYRLLLETGSHDINVLRGAFGSPRKVLSTEIWPNGNWFTTMLDYGGEVRCVLTIARSARNWGDEHITAYGMTSTVAVEFPNPFHKNEATLVHRTTMKGDSTTFETTKASHSEAFKNELKHFHECIAKGRKPLTSIEDALEDTELMTNIIKAYGKKK